MLFDWYNYADANDSCLSIFKFEIRFFWQYTNRNFLTLSGILLGTTELGGNIWYLLPFVWPIKLIFAYTSHEVTSHVILMFLALSVIITVLFIGVFNIWYNRWDGINKMEE